MSARKSDPTLNRATRLGLRVTLEGAVAAALGAAALGWLKTDPVVASAFMIATASAGAYAIQTFIMRRA